MRQEYIKQFEEKFNILFKNVVNVEDITHTSYDDGLYHYINLSNQNIYTFDYFEEEWLEVNAHKDEVMNDINNNSDSESDGDNDSYNSDNSEGNNN